MHVARFLRQAGDGIGIGLAVFLGIGKGHRGLSQHVETVGQPALLLRLGAAHGFLDGAGIDELSADDAHGLPCGVADHRFAHAARGAPQSAGEALFLRLPAFQHLARQHQGEGGGVHEDAAALADVFGPVLRGHLVADERVGGLLVRYPQ